MHATTAREHPILAGIDSVPVLIVGAGPTGVMLAIELARRGVEVRVLDKRPSRPQETRAIAIHARTLEVFHQLGIVEEFLELGHRVDGIIFHTRAWRNAQLQFRSLDSPYPFLLTLSQEETQRILDQRLKSLGITIERGAEVVDLHHDAGGVELGVRHSGERHERAMLGAWVVGCDGAHSIVRRSLGVPFDGEDYGQDWLMAETLIDPPLRRDRFHIFARTAAPLPMFPLPGGRWRIFLPQVPNRTVEERQPPDVEEIERLAAQRGPAGMKVTDPSLLAAFRCYRRSTKLVRHGRVLVAGDAAHIHTPAGGQGMNTGLHDAFNLGWKLALVAQGQSPQTLLDSYQTERVPIAAGVLTLTHTLVRTFTIASPRRRWVRDRVLPPLLSIPTVERRYTTRLAQLSHNYRQGLLMPAAPPRRRRELAPGDRLPDVSGLQLDGRPASTLDLLGSPNHTLLLLSGRRAAPDLVQAALERVTPWHEIVHAVVISGNASCGDRFGVSDPELRVHRRYHAQHGQLLLVRPDGYVACRAPLTRPDVLERHLHQLTSRAPHGVQEPERETVHIGVHWGQT